MAFTVGNSAQRKVRSCDVRVVIKGPDCRTMRTAVLKHMTDLSPALW